MNMSPPSLAPLITKFAPSFDYWSNTPSISPASPDSSRKSTRFSTMMEGLLDRTGKHAAAARAAPDSFPERVRRPVNEVALAKLTSEEPNTNAQDFDGVIQLGTRQILKSVWPNIDWPTRAVIVLGFYAAFVHAVATPCFSYVFAKLLATYSIPVSYTHLTLPTKRIV